MTAAVSWTAPGDERGDRRRDAETPRLRITTAGQPNPAGYLNAAAQAVLDGAGCRFVSIFVVRDADGRATRIRVCGELEATETSRRITGRGLIRDRRLRTVAAPGTDILLERVDAAGDDGRGVVFEGAISEGLQDG